MQPRSDIIEKIRTLRHVLHENAEVSGQETRTRELLWSFLAQNTSLELHALDGGFYAAHREDGDVPSIALRADYDALPAEGGAAHLCGHDGHAAALCGAALLCEGQKIGKNLFFLFQGGEEDGSGALKCLPLFDRERIDAIYGAHNLPGIPLGAVMTRRGTFACASRGLILRFAGRPAHAAYPENGLSPAPAMGELLCALSALTDPKKPRDGIHLCTVIGLRMGEKAFGKAASDAELYLTLRSETNDGIARMRGEILSRAQQLAQRDGLTFSAEEQDVFPAVENDPLLADRILTCCSGRLLPEPMRWSEDFGQYLTRCRGAFFGIGAGEACPPLHDRRYEYPDALLEYAVGAFEKLIFS